MIFQDQQTADDFRKLAREQLIEKVTGMVMGLLTGPDTETYREVAQSNPNHIANWVENELFDHQLALWKSLLFRSGYVFNQVDCTTGAEQPVYAMLTFYDRDPDVRVARAIQESGAMRGGICVPTGQIHT